MTILIPLLVKCLKTDLTLSPEFKIALLAIVMPSVKTLIKKCLTKVFVFLSYAISLIELSFTK